MGDAWDEEPQSAVDRWVVDRSAADSSVPEDRLVGSSAVDS